MITGMGYGDGHLSEEDLRDVLRSSLHRSDWDAKRVLVIIPDGTRSAPLPLFFRMLYSELGATVERLDYLIALGTHQPMGEGAIERLLGVSAEERQTRYPNVAVLNHRWDKPDTFTTLGVISASRLGELSEGRLSLDVPVTINRRILEYDQLIICGPVFPHEIVGFSGGHKYFFPGISGPHVIDVSHWLGGLLTSKAIIGTKDTPVRRMIDYAASLVPVPTLCLAFVVAADHEHLAGLYVGPPKEAWSLAADLSARVNITYVERPFTRALTIVPQLYDDLWTAAKGMYKLEPAMADGAEVVLYAPWLSEVSYTHGAVIDEVGYHVRDYFVKQWDRFKGYPWGVLTHCTTATGVGEYDAETGVETPRVRLTLATGIPRERCERINLGYRDPATIDPEEWAGREHEGVILVRRGGEKLFRLRRGGEL
jgi:nickel-dependent lactate racemase